MPTIRPLPSQIAWGVFTVADADRLGVPRGRLFRGGLRRPHRGVRSDHDAATVDDRCLAYLPLMRDDRVFSHSTAAQLHEFPLPKAVQDDRTIHVSVITPGQPPRARGVTGHRVTDRPGVRDMTHGLPVTSDIETWCALASLLAPAWLVVVGDHLVRRGVPHPDRVLETMRAAIGAVRRRGAVALACALDRVRPGVRSPMETVLRLAIVDAGLPEPLVNHLVHDAAGRFVGEGDLVYLAQRLVIEYEGVARHLLDEAQWAEDIRRRERFEDAGWSVLRVTKSDLFVHRADLMARIERRLAA